MNDPYQTLGLPKDASDEDIRRRYLELVKQFSPEHAPERFNAIRQAYEVLKDAVTRVRYRLFEAGMDDHLEDLVSQLKVPSPRRRLGLAELIAQVTRP